MNKPLSFFKKQKTVTYTQTQTEQGIANYCCDEMKFACEPCKLKEKKMMYGKMEKIIADSILYGKETNDIGMNLHKAYCGSYSEYPSYYNYKKFSYCPFCGTKINGYINIDKDK
jgi:hypothetical protein